MYRVHWLGANSDWCKYEYDDDDGGAGRRDERVDRMLEGGESPIFVLYHHDVIPAPFEAIRQFMLLDVPHERYVVMYDRAAYEWCLQQGLDEARICLGNVKRNDQLPLVK